MPTSSDHDSARPQSPGATSAIILAAGFGKRMRSELPKVLHQVGGRPMVCAVIDACLQVGCARVVLVVGYREELVREAIAREYAGDERSLQAIRFARQPEQLGTGHAVRCAEALFSAERSAPDSPVLVLAGDGPLIRPATLRRLIDRHAESRAAATIATSIIDDPTGYGRIVRGADGRFAAIVEHKHCTPPQLAIREVNPSYYCFDAQALFNALPLVPRQETGGEYYLTDVPGLLLASGRVVEVLTAVPPEDVLSINTPEHLAEVDAIYRARGSSGAPAGAAGRLA